VVTDPAAAGGIFYHVCSPQEQAWAFERLTPMSVEVATTPVSIPRFWSAPIPRDYILCTDDHTHPVASDNASPTSRSNRRKAPVAERQNIIVHNNFVHDRSDATAS
jgi:hypothetical protein